MAAESPPAEPQGLAIAPTLDGSATNRQGASASQSAPRVAVNNDPARVGRYVVLRRLGQGGMGVVYLAYDGDLDRKVAVKVVRGSAQQGPLAHERVLQEAQSLAQVAHPNIVHVYEVGQSDEQSDGQSNGQIFIAMEYVPGVTLGSWQNPPTGTSRPSVERILRVYLQAATGLYAAHCRGLVHRDFKPDNVLLDDDGRARVLDFGLARVLDRPVVSAPLSAEPSSRLPDEDRLTQLGAIMGTPGYMSPEQVRGADADARSDQFSFCAALYEALYERLPFAGETFETYSQEVLAGRLLPPPPTEIPLAVEQALRRGLETAPERRFPSMAELIKALESGLDPDSESASTRRANRRFRAVIVVLTILTTVGGLRNGLDRGTRNLLHAMIMIGGLLISLGVVLFMLRKTLLRRASYRRVAYSFVIIVIFMLLARLFGYVQGMDLGRYASFEMLAMAALLAIEVPHASLQYRWLAALSLVGAVVTLLQPQLSVLILTVVYPVLAVAGAYYRITEATHEEKPTPAR